MLLPPSNAIMEAAPFSETSVNFFQTTQRHISDDSKHQNRMAFLLRPYFKR